MGVTTISAVSDAAYYEDYASLAAVPPRWLGSSPTLDLGLTRPPVISVVDADGRRVVEGDVVRLLEARHPETGESLLDGGGRQKHRRPGFDVCFSPPKSVSILEMAARLEGDSATANAVWAAHRAAVDKTFAWLEDELAVARRGHGGRDGTIRARVAAVAFEHATSREDDPQIHTHVVLPNLAWGEDGKVTALWADRFWAGRSAREHIVRDLSAIYGAALRQELTQRLGVSWTEPKGRDRHREVEGVPRRAIAEFSRRRRQVQARLAETGAGNGGKARQAAQLSTRTAKSERLAADLAPQWAERLQALRLRPRRVLRQVELHARRRRAEAATEPTMPDVRAVLDRLHGPGGGATWTRHDLMAALAAEVPTGAAPDQLALWADEILSGGEVVEVTSPLVPPPEAEATAAHAPSSAPRYMAAWLLRAEEKVVELAAQVERVGVAPETVEAVIAGSTLDDEQAEMVRSVCSDGFVHVVAAAAGSGKTFALGVALKAWRAAGRDVLGVGPSWRAANELADVGITSWAYDALVGRSGPGLAAIPRGGVLVVDETSMMPTRALASLLEFAAKNDAQVVLVGDPRQLGSVEAGGLYALFASARGVSRLERNRRQAADWQVAALTDLREGRAARAAAACVQAGDVVVAPDEAAAVRQLLDDWWEARDSGAEVAILASTRDGADSLNALAHARLLAAGALGREAVVLAETTEHDGLPERELRAGDEVRFRKRRYFSGRVSVANGDTATVMGVSPTHVELRLRSGHVVRSTVSWAGDHLDWGYASTIHSTQGRTVGSARAKRERGGQVKRGECFVLAADSLGLESAYVAASRAVDRTRLYLSPDPTAEHDSHLFDRDGQPIEPSPPDPIARLTRSWGEVDADEAGEAEARRQERVAWLASHRTRAELERSLERAQTLQRAAEAREPDEDDGSESGEPVPDAVDLVKLRSDLRLLEQALEVQRRAAVSVLALRASRGEAPWLTQIIGDIPPDRAGQLRWREAAGAVEDARHWVDSARRRSPSLHVQALAAHTEGDLLRLARLPDRRPLEELVADTDETAARAALRDQLPDAFRGALKRAAVVRQVRALAWLGPDGVDLDRVADRVQEVAGFGAPPVAAVATALREACAAEVARRLAAGESVPLAVAAAVEPGLTIPAVRSLIEAAELGAELRARAGVEPEVPAPPSPRAPAGASGVSRAPAGAPEVTARPAIPLIPDPTTGPDPQGGPQWQTTL